MKSSTIFRDRPADARINLICNRLEIDNPRFIEIESKKKIVPEQSEPVREYLMSKKNVRHIKSTSFFDQYLDTPGMDILKLGASLRLRYKGNGTKVYLQYKGPGFHRDGILFRSEFSSERLANVLREESHHDMVQFTETSVREILDDHVSPAMNEAMRRHLGQRVLRKISIGPIICNYSKDKFSVELGSVFLEPSVDQVYAFQINRTGLHALSTFYEYENEIKSPAGSIIAKLEHLDEMKKFDEELVREFDLIPERLDKYRRCASCFIP